MLYYLKKGEHYIMIQLNTEEIRKRCRKNGWTQGEFAERIGMDASALSRRLTGDVKTSLDWLDRMSNVLRCKPGQLLTYQREGANS
jgi:transcriptional regulator with XRE-family HTH domain